MDQMAPAEGGEFIAVEKPVEPVAGQFRDNHGIYQSRDHSNECS